MGITPHRYQTLVYGDDRLNSTRKAICIRIAFASLSTKDRHGWVELSHKCIGKDLAIKRENVSRHLKWLIENGYLIRLQPMEPGRYLTGQYRLSSKAFRVTEGDTVHVMEGDTVHVTNRRTSSAFPSQQRRSSLQTAPPTTRPHAAAEVATEKDLEPSAAPVPAQPQAAGPDATETKTGLGRIQWPDGFAYNGLDPSAVDHLAVVTATPAEIAAALGRTRPGDRDDVHEQRDPVLAVACPVKWCPTRPGHKCKDPDHPSGHHAQRILAASEAAVSVSA